MPKKRVLVVDDLADQRILMSAFLSEDYHVELAENGEEGLTKAMEYLQPDIILLDIEMPGLNGFEVIGHLKREEQTFQIPVIFITAQDQPEMETKGLELGAVDYITKPLNRSVVLARIKTQLSLFETNKNLQSIIERELLRHRETDSILARLEYDSKSEVIRDIAHHWRNPLSVLSISLGLMLDKNENESEMDHYHRMLEKGNRLTSIAHDLSRTIDEYRQMFASERGVRREFPIRDQIEQVMRLHKPFLEGLRVDVQINGALDAEFYGYVSDFNIVLYQIIKNAHEALQECSGDDPKIEIEIIDDSFSLMVSVHDNGGGVDSKLRHSIFDPYVSTRSQHSGKGMGLFISKKIIEQRFDGDITWSNLKDGAKFLIRFPKSMGLNCDKSCNNPVNFEI